MNPYEKRIATIEGEIKDLQAELAQLRIDYDFTRRERDVLRKFFVKLNLTDLPTETLEDMTVTAALLRAIDGERKIASLPYLDAPPLEPMIPWTGIEVPSDPTGSAVFSEEEKDYIKRQ
jgi:hypothetical protein